MRADIQGLRAVAVLLVVLDHAGVPGMRGGFVGVDVFFVVSGFLITSLLVREATTTGRVSIGEFYGRRARRILPAATVVLLAVTAYAAIELAASRVEQVVEDVRWAAFFLANVHFAALDTEYFALDRAPSPVQHYWSLAVEEQFYLVWPVVLALLLTAGRPAADRQGRARDRIRVAASVVAVGWVASFALSVLMTAHAPAAAYFSSVTRAWELATGALLALGARQLPRLGVRTRHVLAASGLVAVLVAAMAYDPATPFPGWRAAVPVLGTAAVLAAGAGGGPVGLARLLVVRPLPWVGDLSYSLYLWHWPVLVLGPPYVSDLPRVPGTLLLLAVALAASVLSFYLIENPIRRSRRVLRRPRSSLALWPAALASVILGAALASSHANSVLAERMNTVVKVPTLDRPPGVDSTPPAVRVRIADALHRADVDGPIPFPLDNFKGLRRDLWQFRFRCSSNWEETDAEICPVGDAKAKRTVVLYGDSFGGQWLPALHRIGQRSNLRVVPLVKFGCAPFDVPQLYQGRAFDRCEVFRDWALEQIKRLEPDVVVLGYRGLWEVDPADGRSESEAWSAGAASTLKRLSTLTKDVKVIASTSPLTFDPAECLTTPDSTMSSCTSPEQKDEREGNRLTRAVADSLSVDFVDVTGLVCLDRRCPLVVDRIVTHRDPAHITITWGHEVTDELERLLDLRVGPREP